MADSIFLSLNWKNAWLEKVESTGQFESGQAPKQSLQSHDPSFVLIVFLCDSMKPGWFNFPVNKCSKSNPWKVESIGCYESGQAEFQSLKINTPHCVSLRFLCDSIKMYWFNFPVANFANNFSILRAPL